MFQDTKSLTNESYKTGSGKFSFNPGGEALYPGSRGGAPPGLGRETQEAGLRLPCAYTRAL